ncbi:PREDICTED: putative E3 ubiquitin-protein ligase RING1b [Lupinus angustifolius]|uniref:putative E3 ubiquitin-protein ligase RING1b n=1 Tax=Lupinus angustifolius TaxID=3871 RepID=UPI00092EF708|nr:PREDICTED: putative E3 ubiquitin-protein ligase RING1b [Lupinus angustifolius]
MAPKRRSHQYVKGDAKHNHRNKDDSSSQSSKEQHGRGSAPTKHNDEHVRQVVLALPAVVRCPECSAIIPNIGIPKSPSRLCKKCGKKSKRQKKCATSRNDEGTRGLSPIDEDMEIRPESRNLEQAATTVVEVSDGTSSENHLDFSRKIKSSSNTFTWGRNGARSNTRAKKLAASRKERMSRLIDHLCKIEEDDDEYVAYQTSLQTEEIELYLLKECPTNVTRIEGTIDTSKHQCQFLTRKEDNLAELKISNEVHGNLVIAYKKKMWDLNELLPEDE